MKIIRLASFLYPDLPKEPEWFMPRGLSKKDAINREATRTGESKNKIKRRCNINRVTGTIELAKICRPRVKDLMHRKTGKTFRQIRIENKGEDGANEN